VSGNAHDLDKIINEGMQKE